MQATERGARPVTMCDNASPQTTLEVGSIEPRWALARFSEVAHACTSDLLARCHGLDRDRD
jgi:hypothetical protein